MTFFSRRAAFLFAALIYLLMTFVLSPERPIAQQSTRLADIVGKWSGVTSGGREYTLEIQADGTYRTHFPATAGNREVTRTGVMQERDGQIFWSDKNGERGRSELRPGGVLWWSSGGFAVRITDGSGNQPSSGTETKGDSGGSPRDPGAGVSSSTGGETECTEKFRAAYGITMTNPGASTQAWKMMLFDQTFDPLLMQMSHQTLDRVLLRYFGSWEKCIASAATVVDPFIRRGGKLANVRSINWPVRANADERQSRYRAFADDHKVQQAVNCQELLTNPYAFEGQTVAVAGAFMAMTARDAAAFQGAGECPFVVSGIPYGTFSTQRIYVFIAAKVLGQTEMKVVGGAGGQVPHLQFLGIYACQRKDCDDITP